MRSLALFAVLVTLTVAPAEAQTPSGGSPDTRALSNAQELAFFGSTVAATVGGTVLIVRVAAEADSPWPIYALPFAPVAAACAVGAAMQLGGSCGQAAKTTLMWSLPAYALIAIAQNSDTGDRIGYIGLGVLWLVIAPPFAAMEGYRLSIEPAVVADPASERTVPGVQLRIGL